MQSLRIAYAGTPDFAVPALEAIINSHHQLVAVLTQPDRKSGRGRKISKSAVKQSVTSLNVQILQPENINTDESINELSSLNLDLLVVAAYGQIFSQRLLNLPKMGCINIHASLLPKWRGASPIQHAILAGDEKSGITVMQMQKDMDAGDIWLQAQCPIHDDDNAQSLHDKLAQLGGSIILEAIETVTQKFSIATPQDPLLVSYCSKLKKNDGLINWNEPAKEIWRKVRAFHPWPGAFTSLNGRRLRITKANLAGSVIPPNIPPGTVHEASKSGITVVTGKDSIVIIELIPEGGKRVSAADFTNSNQLENQKLGEVIN